MSITAAKTDLLIHLVNEHLKCYVQYQDSQFLVEAERLLKELYEIKQEENANEDRTKS